MKPFNIYHHVGAGKLDSWVVRRGFAARVEQSDDPRYVNVFVSFCSKKDEFNKKKGIAVAKANGSIKVHKKQVPLVLTGFYDACFAPPFSVAKTKYDFVYKYFF